MSRQWAALSEKIGQLLGVAKSLRAVSHARPGSELQQPLPCASGEQLHQVAETGQEAARIPLHQEGGALESSATQQAVETPVDQAAEEAVACNPPEVTASLVLSEEVQEEADSDTARPEAAFVPVDNVSEVLWQSVAEDVEQLVASIEQLAAAHDAEVHDKVLSLKGLLGLTGAAYTRHLLHEWQSQYRNFGWAGSTENWQGFQQALLLLQSQHAEAVPAPASSSMFGADFLDMDWLNEAPSEAPAAMDEVAAHSSPADEEEEEEEEDSIVLDILPVAMAEIEELVPEIERGLLELLDGNSDVIGELHRQIHTLKGTVGMAGSRSARTLLHAMETKMEGLHGLPAKEFTRELLDQFDLVRQRIALMAQVSAPDAPQGEEGEAPAPERAAVQTKKAVRVPAEAIDTLIANINDARLVNSSLLEQLGSFRGELEDLENNSQRISMMLRELDMHAESQIQSRRTQLAETGEEFDPLELDRFTRLQELSRLLTEGVSDILEVYREMSRMSSDQETMLASQKRVLQSTQQGLHRTRLTPFEAINDSLYTVVWKTAHELGKEASFSLVGGRVELDRVLLEKIVVPLHHILRNSLAHGIESPADRLAAGKPVQGKIEVQVRQEAGRALISVSDDGAGIQVARVRQRAIEKGLWSPDKPMDDRQAADMICQPGFSTAAAVSQISGRGVGMDVVRSEILTLGGRFDLLSVEGQGLMVMIQLPTSIATAAVLVVEGGGESWALPIDSVEHIVRVRGEELQQARAQGQLTVDLPGQATLVNIPFVSLQDLTHVWDPSWMPGSSAPVVLARDGDRWMAIEVARLHPVIEAPLRPLGRPWNRIQGFAGSVVLADGRAIFLLDPFRIPRAEADSLVAEEKASVVKVPLVLVVDDSVTVRKATERFLTKQGIASVLAKDGQEALDILVGLKPDLVLLDVEMPRMDGFVCAKNIRESSRHHDLPIVMITSRTADKHRQRALELGVNEYLGKPFNEEEMLAVLDRFVHKKAEPKQSATWPAINLPFSL